MAFVPYGFVLVQVQVLYFSEEFEPATAPLEFIARQSFIHSKLDSKGHSQRTCKLLKLDHQRHDDKTPRVFLKPRRETAPLSIPMAFVPNGFVLVSTIGVRVQGMV
jgi:hypothetical protein